MCAKPVIGLTLDSEQPGGYSTFPWCALRENYFSAVRNAGGLPFALASDTDLAVASAYDVVAEDDRRRSRRALFVIEQDGAVSYAAPHFSPNNISQLEGAFRALGLEL